MSDELAPAKVTWADRVLAVQRRREEMYVRGDKGAARRELGLAVVGFVVLVAAWNAASWGDDTTWGEAAGLIFVGLAIGLVPFAALRRAQAYRRGWMDGRRALATSLDEATRRGMSHREWVLAELERDWNTLI